MTGEYKVDRDRIYDFHKKFLKRVAIYLGVPWAIMVTLVISRGEMPFLGVGIMTLLYVVVFAGVMAQTGGYVFKAFERTHLVLDDKRVIRFGEGLVTARIDYDKISRVVRIPHGIVIIKKGIVPFLNYYLTKSALRLNDDVIFIPYLLRDYDALEDFFVNKKYLHPDNLKAKRSDE